MERRKVSPTWLSASALFGSPVEVRVSWLKTRIVFGTTREGALVVHTVDADLHLSTQCCDRLRELVYTEARRTIKNWEVGVSLPEGLLHSADFQDKILRIIATTVLELDPSVIRALSECASSLMRISDRQLYLPMSNLMASLDGLAGHPRVNVNNPEAFSVFFTNEDPNLPVMAAAARRHGYAHMADPTEKVTITDYGTIVPGRASNVWTTSSDVPDMPGMYCVVHYNGLPPMHWHPVSKELILYTLYYFVQKTTDMFYAMASGSRAYWNGRENQGVGIATSIPLSNTVRWLRALTMMPAPPDEELPWPTAASFKRATFEEVTGWAERSYDRWIKFWRIPSELADRLVNDRMSFMLLIPRNVDGISDVETFSDVASFSVLVTDAHTRIARSRSNKSGRVLSYPDGPLLTARHVQATLMGAYPRVGKPNQDGNVPISVAVVMAPDGAPRRPENITETFEAVVGWSWKRGLHSILLEMQAFTYNGWSAENALSWIMRDGKSQIDARLPVPLLRALIALFYDTVSVVKDGIMSYTAKGVPRFVTSSNVSMAVHVVNFMEDEGISRLGKVAYFYTGRSGGARALKTLAQSVDSLPHPGGAAPLDSVFADSHEEVDVVVWDVPFAASAAEFSNSVGTQAHVCTQLLARCRTLFVRVELPHPAFMNYIKAESGVTRMYLTRSSFDGAYSLSCWAVFTKRPKPQFWDMSQPARSAADRAKRDRYVISLTRSDYYEPHGTPFVHTIEQATRRVDDPPLATDVRVSGPNRDPTLKAATGFEREWMSCLVSQKDLLYTVSQTLRQCNDVQVSRTIGDTYAVTGRLNRARCFYSSRVPARYTRESVDVLSSVANIQVDAGLVDSNDTWMVIRDTVLFARGCAFLAANENNQVVGQVIVLGQPTFEGLTGEIGKRAFIHVYGSRGPTPILDDMTYVFHEEPVNWVEPPRPTGRSRGGLAIFAPTIITARGNGGVYTVEQQVRGLEHALRDYREHAGNEPCVIFTYWFDFYQVIAQSRLSKQDASVSVIDYQVTKVGGTKEAPLPAPIVPVVNVPGWGTFEVPSATVLLTLCEREKWDVRRMDLSPWVPDCLRVLQSCHRTLRSRSAGAVLDNTVVGVSITMR